MKFLPQECVPVLKLMELMARPYVQSMEHQLSANPTTCVRVLHKLLRLFLSMGRVRLHNAAQVSWIQRVTGTKHTHTHTINRFISPITHSLTHSMKHSRVDQPRKQLCIGVCFNSLKLHVIGQMSVRISIVRASSQTRRIEKRSHSSGPRRTNS